MLRMKYWGWIIEGEILRMKYYWGQTGRHVSKAGTNKHWWKSFFNTKIVLPLVSKILSRFIVRKDSFVVTRQDIARQDKRRHSNISLSRFIVRKDLCVVRMKCWGQTEWHKAGTNKHWWKSFYKFVSKIFLQLFSKIFWKLFSKIFWKLVSKIFLQFVSRIFLKIVSKRFLQLVSKIVVKLVSKI